MNIEHPPFNPEEERRILTREEIQSRLKEFCSQEDQKLERVLEDEKGVYLYEVSAVDEGGDASLYSYRRLGNYKETKAANTVIDVVYYVGSIEDGMCVGGDTLSNYDENSGIWVDV
jgi:hypothetical protein